MTPTRIHVAAGVGEAHVLRLLGRHVAQAREHGARGRHRGAVALALGGVAHAEPAQLDGRQVLRDQHLPRSDVVVDDAALVRGFERVAQRLEDGERLRDRQPPPAHQLVERSECQSLFDQEELVAVTAAIEHARHVGMTQLGELHRLVPELADPRLVLRHRIDGGGHRHRPPLRRLDRLVEERRGGPPQLADHLVVADASGIRASFRHGARRSGPSRRSRSYPSHGAPGVRRARR